MNCPEVQHLIPDFLLGETDDDQARGLQDHARGCDACRRELEHLGFLWSKLGVIPEEQPGPGLREGFYAMLESRLAPGPKRVSLGDWVRGWWPRRPALQLGLALGLAVLGMGAGWLLKPGGNGEGTAVARLGDELEQTKNTVAVSLLSQTSPFDRLQGVQVSAGLSRPEDSTLESLLTILDSDPSVSVRLAAVEALFLFADRPRVKEGILASLPRQESPLVQVALVDLLVGIKEKRALRALEELIKNQELEPDVQTRIQRGIQALS